MRIKNYSLILVRAGFYLEANSKLINNYTGCGVDEWNENYSSRSQISWRQEKKPTEAIILG